MDTPEPPPSPRPRLVSRRNLLRLAGAGAAIGLSAEFGRVVLGSNEHTVIPGKVYRSAQLSEEKLIRVIAEKHIRTVVNLRGCCPETAWYMNDARATFAAGISQEDITLSAKRYPPPSELRRLVEVLDRTEYPILFHCAAGADRTGVASTMALLLLTDATLARARRQMWPRYGHLNAGRTAVLDQFFDYYETALAAGGEAHTPGRFRKWVAEEYCPGPFRAALSVVAPAPLSVPAGVGSVVTVRAANTAVEPWRFKPGGGGGVCLRYTLHAQSGEFLYRGHAGLFSRTVNPGDSIDLQAGLPPVANPGPHVFRADMLDSQPIDLLDSDFAQYGSDPLIAPLSVV
jgi:hypothetical protein